MDVFFLAWALATAAINAAAFIRCAASLAARAARSRASSIACCSRLRRAYAAQAARNAAAAPPHRGRLPKGRRGASGGEVVTCAVVSTTTGPLPGFPPLLGAAGACGGALLPVCGAAVAVGVDVGTTTGPAGRVAVGSGVAVGSAV
ncbi:MAG TPA: hypothetical protein ENJ54_07885, partial [Chloroflexi bacterium]|nr:hypothetical protein [Chloroflexota bacterium]